MTFNPSRYNDELNNRYPRQQDLQPQYLHVSIHQKTLLKRPIIVTKTVTFYIVLLIPTPYLLKDLDNEKDRLLIPTLRLHVTQSLLERENTYVDRK